MRVYADTENGRSERAGGFGEKSKLHLGFERHAGLHEDGGEHAAKANGGERG